MFGFPVFFISCFCLTLVALSVSFSLLWSSSFLPFLLLFFSSPFQLTLPVRQSPHLLNFLQFLLVCGVLQTDGKLAFVSMKEGEQKSFEGAGNFVLNHHLMEEIELGSPQLLMPLCSLLLVHGVIGWGLSHSILEAVIPNFLLQCCWVAHSYWKIMLSFLHWSWASGKALERAESGITFASYHEMPACLKPPVAFPGLYPLFQMVLRRQGKSRHDMACCSLRMKSVAATSHADFIGLKTARSSGCSRCVRCGGSFRRCTLLSCAKTQLSLIWNMGRMSIKDWQHWWILRSKWCEKHCL